MRIALNAGGLGGVPISGFQSDASNLTNKIDAMIVGFVSIKHLTCNLNGGVGALQGALDSVQARVNAEISRKEAAIAAQVQVNSFLALAIQIDDQVAVMLQQNKEEFYSVNPWLKPSSEKSFWEKLGDGWNNFWSGVGDFLKKAKDGLVAFCNSSLGKIVIGVVVIAALALAVVLTGGAAAGVAGFILAGALKGAIIGALTSAAIGAATSAIGHRLSTGSWEGVGKAMFDGAACGFMSGAILGGIFGAAGNALKVMAAARSWNPGNFKSGFQSMRYHYQQHVINEGFAQGNNIVKYTRDALNFSNRNVSLLRFIVPNNPNLHQYWGLPDALKYVGQGGQFDALGKIFTFWYKAI